MNGKGATATLILVFLPIYFAIIRMIFQFEISDLIYLLVVLVVVVRYYISKRA